MAHQIAPHENNEVRLVLSGAKPLATIEKGKDPYGYALAVAMAGTGSIYSNVRPTADSPTGEIIIVKAGNKNHIETYLYLLEKGVEQYGVKEYHRRMGELFGYSDEDIEAFIDVEIECSCSKCVGKYIVWE
jgi:hypothetical protein